MIARTKKVIVTGASGFIGYHVSKLLCSMELDVHLLSRRKGYHIIDLVSRGAKVHIVDLTNPREYGHLLEGADCLFHLAAENNIDQAARESIIRSTLTLTKILLKEAFARNVKTIIYTSSAAVLGRSMSPSVLITENDQTKSIDENPYVRGKFEADAVCEDLIKTKNMDIRRLYPSWVLGSDALKCSPVQSIIKDFLSKRQLFYFKGGVSPASVESVAEAHINAWLKGKPGEKYVVGGENITLLQFYTILARFSNKSVPKFYLPKIIITVGVSTLALISKIVGRKPPVDPGYVKAVVCSYSWYDSEKAIRELGYKIQSAENVLKLAVDYEKKRLKGTHILGKKYNFSQLEEQEKALPILITGVPGRVGNRFVDIMINGDTKGNLVKRRKVKLLVEPKFVHLLDLPNNFEICPGDICDPEAVSNALNGVHTVFHLAANMGESSKPRDLYRVNYGGTKNLVDQCISMGVRRFIYMCTDAVCKGGSKKQRILNENTLPKPLGHYGKSKLLGEEYVLKKTKDGLIDGTSMRVFWIFGPFALERQIEWFKQPSKILFGNGNNYRGVIHIDNIVYAFLKAEDEVNTFGKWYWIAEEKLYTYNRIYELISSAIGIEFRPSYKPRIFSDIAGILYTISGFFGFNFRMLHTIITLGRDISGSVEAAKRDFGYNPPISLDMDTQEYINEFC